MKEVKIFMIAVAVLLLPTSYFICDYFYYIDGVLDRKGWWDLKSALYAIILAVILQSYIIGTESGVLRFTLQIATGLTASNVLDKTYFNVLVFNEKDIIMIIATVVFAFGDYHKEYIKCQLTRIYYKLFSRIKGLIKKTGCTIKKK